MTFRTNGQGLCRAHASRGNALFLILIAVALFAALSYAITQSGRGGGTIDREQATLYAAQIMQVAANTEMGVQRMILNGTSASSITAAASDSDYPGGGTDNDSADFCTSGTDCLFAAEGGGVAIPEAPRGALEGEDNSTYSNAWGDFVYFSGPHSYHGVSINNMVPGHERDRAVTGEGTDAADDMIIVMPLKKDVCDAINKGLGITGDYADMDNDQLTHHAACVIGGGGTYVFYQVILPH